MSVSFQSGSYKHFNKPQTGQVSHLLSIEEDSLNFFATPQKMYFGMIFQSQSPLQSTVIQMMTVSQKMANT